MKVLIPTAKELNKKAEAVKKERINKKTEIIVEEFAKKSPEQLAKIYKIKEEKAAEEYNRWQNIKLGTADYYPALELFNGLMYRNIAREDFLEQDKNYIQKHVFITTSLYGIINAYDPICEHRLDFLQNVKIEGKSLKNFWNEEYNNSIQEEEVVVSLLSSEFEEVFSKKFRDRFIKIKFMEDKNGELKTHSTISKKARGKFLTQLIKKEVLNVEQIRAIQFEDFRYSAEHSTALELVFIAKK